MPKGKPALSDMERELRGLEHDTGGYMTKPMVAAQLKGTERCKTSQAVSPSETAPEEAATSPAPLSMQIVTPMDVSVSSAIVPKARKTGTINFLSGDGQWGFITINEDTRDIHFSDKHCFGLMRALRVGDEVTFFLKENQKRLWAHDVERTRK